MRSKIQLKQVNNLSRPLTLIILIIILALLSLMLVMPGLCMAENAHEEAGLQTGTDDVFSERFGVAQSCLISLVFHPELEKMYQQLDAVREAGIGWIRFTFGWDDFEPEQGNWDPEVVERADLAVARAGELGINILGILGGTPGWANGGKPGGYPPDDMNTWREFVHELCSRYAGSVAAWEIWNEENIWPFWEGTVEEYVELLGCASEEIREVDPDAKVVMGGLAGPSIYYPWGIGWDFFGSCLGLGAAECVDAIAYHPYSDPNITGDLPPPFGTPWPHEKDWKEIANNIMPDFISQYTGKDLELWITEVGWTTRRHLFELWAMVVDEPTQAAYILRTLIFYAGGTEVDKIFTYNLWNDFDDVWAVNNYGLLRNDFSEKPSYKYYECFENIFGRAVSTAPEAVSDVTCNRPDTLEMYCFNLDDEDVAIAAWKTDDRDDSLSFKFNDGAYMNPFTVDPLTGSMKLTPGVSRDPMGKIIVEDLAIGKHPVILLFQRPIVNIVEWWIGW